MSGFLLDTNILSELVKPKPETKVLSWLEQIDEELLYLSVLTIGEIRKGTGMLPQASRRTAIEAWLDKDIADRWGKLTARALSKKTMLPVIDGLLAATALHHNLTLVTRNTKDTAGIEIRYFNPWE